MRVALPRDRRDVLRQVGSAAVLMATRPLWAQGPAARSAPIVAAASDLKFALDEVVAAFSAQTGQPIRVVYGSSGLLAMQIRQGAPLELFLSADEAFVNDLAVAGLLRDAGLVYAIGQIALAVPRASMIQLDSGLRGLRAAVSAGAGQAPCHCQSRPCSLRPPRSRSPHCPASLGCPQGQAGAWRKCIAGCAVCGLGLERWWSSCPVTHHGARVFGAGSVGGCL